jgi:hypothetical protein
MLAMQTLGLAESPRTESRFKSLFWPSIQSATDVDYLETQGYWVCTFVAAVTFLLLLMAGQYILAPALLLFFYFGGVGVRERDVFAGAIVFAYYGLDTLITMTVMLFVTPLGMIVFRLFACALLLSNLRATWIASTWKSTSENAVLPPRLGDTFADKFADLWPAWIWPKVRWGYYIFSTAVMLFFLLGIVFIVLRSMHLLRLPH